MHSWARHALANLQGRLALDQRGAGLVEYALLLALIVLVCIAAVTFFGASTSGQYSNISSQFPQ